MNPILDHALQNPSPASLQSLEREVAALRMLLAQTNGMLTQVLRQQGQWLTAQQVCDRLKVSPKTLFNWRKAGRFPAPARNGKYQLEDIMNWEKSQCERKAA